MFIAINEFEVNGACALQSTTAYKILAINPRGAISSVEDRAIGLDFSLWRAGTEHLVEMDVAAALV